jgi:hypothetical protein
MASADRDTVTITQRLMKPGRFHVELAPPWPDSVARSIALFDHLVITPTQVDIDSLADASILALAIYTGVITSKPSVRSMEGADLSHWLGTDQGLGDIIDTPIALTANTLSQWVTALCPTSLTVGTVNNTGTGTLSRSFQWVTRREALDSVCQTLGAEWRVTSAGKIDAATRANLWTTPSATSGVVITRRAEGFDGGIQGMDARLMVPSSDVEQYTTKAFALGQGVGTSVLVGSSTGTTTYKDLNNNSVIMERLVNAPSDPLISLTAVAAASVGQFNSVRTELSLSSRTYTITRFIRPGDDVYVHDLQAGLVDPANTIDYRGELIQPIKLRCVALTWPLERGCGVYLRKSGATPTYIDLTPYVAWESGQDVQWEVGAASRASVGDSPTGTASLPTTLAVESRVGVESGTLVNPVKFAGVATNVTSTGTWEVDGPWINMVVGATFTGAPVAGNLTIDLPKPTIVVPGANNSIMPWGSAGPLSQGVQFGPGGYVGDTANVVVSTMRVFSGAPWAGWSNLVPFVWKATDGLVATIRYRWV